MPLPCTYVNEYVIRMRATNRGKERSKKGKVVQEEERKVKQFTKKVEVTRQKIALNVVIREFYFPQDAFYHRV